MLKVNSATLTANPLSQPGSFETQMSTETESNPPAPMTATAPMMAYQYPMAYTNQMVHVQAPTYTPMMAPAAMQSMPQLAQLSSGNLLSAGHTISPPGLSAASSSDLSLCYGYSTPDLLHQISQTTQIVPPPRQPASYPQQALISVKPANQMNVYETANWVKTVGDFQGWAESHQYAQAFYHLQINGITLPRVTEVDLETRMGVTNASHRQTLMSRIQSIYPFLLANNSSNLTIGSTTDQESVMDAGSDSETELVRPQLRMDRSKRRKSYLASMSQRNLLQHDKEETPINGALQLGRPTLADQSSYTSNNSMRSVSSYASSAATDSSNASSLAGQPRGAHLLCTLPAAPASIEKGMYDLKKTFAEAGFVVHPRVSEKADNKFILRFENETQANRALSMAEELGYDLKEHTEFTRKKGPRPTPSNPQQYMVLHHARMRSGKSMKSQVLGFVNKGQIYWVNQIKGKRARLIERTDSGDRNLGWVSLRNNAGYQLMAPFHE